MSRLLNPRSFTRRPGVTTRPASWRAGKTVPLPVFVTPTTLTNLIIPSTISSQTNSSVVALKDSPTCYETSFINQSTFLSNNTSCPDSPLTSAGEDGWHAWFIPLLSLFAIATTFSNGLVLFSILSQKALRTSTNFCLVSLALADMLVGAIVMPLATSQELTDDQWLIGSFSCDIFQACDIMASTCSILNLCLISHNRYMAIAKPLIYNTSHRRKMYVSIGIAITWLISIVLSAPLLLGVNEVPSDSKHATICAIRNGTYAINISIFSFFLPSIAITVQLVLIFRAIAKRASHIQLHVYTPRHSHDDQLDEYQAAPFFSKHDNNNIGEICNEVFDESKQETTNGAPAKVVDAERPPKRHQPAFSVDPCKPQQYRRGTACGNRTSQIQSEPSPKKRQSTGNEMTIVINLPRLPANVGTNSETPSRSKIDSITSPSQNSKPWKFLSKHQTANGYRDSRPKKMSVSSCPSTFMSSTRLLREDRAIAMLFFITVSFFTCWVPYFIATVVNGIVHELLPAILIDALRWLGHINSMMNPFIYCVFNKEFRNVIWQRLTMQPTATLSRAPSVASQIGGYGLANLYTATMKNRGNLDE